MHTQIAPLPLHLNIDSRKLPSDILVCGEIWLKLNLNVARLIKFDCRMCNIEGILIWEGNSREFCEKIKLIEVKIRGSWNFAA